MFATMADAAVSTDDLMSERCFLSPYRSANDLTTFRTQQPLRSEILEREEDDGDLALPEWIDPLDVLQPTAPKYEVADEPPPPSPNRVSDLEHFTYNRNKWMLMHEQERRVLPNTVAAVDGSPLHGDGENEEFISSIAIADRLVPPRELVVGEKLSQESMVTATFDKTVGGQLTEGRFASAVAHVKPKQPPGRDKQTAVWPQLDAFGSVPLKAWLPAVLPWRKRGTTDGVTTTASWYDPFDETQASFQ